MIQSKIKIQTRGSIKKIFFHSADTNYGAFLFAPSDGTRPFKVSGRFLGSVGDPCEVRGKMGENPKYGLQCQASSVIKLSRTSMAESVKGEDIHARIKGVTYYSDETGFCVLYMYCEDRDTFFSATGVLLSPQVGSSYILKGMWKENKNGGRDFACSEIIPEMPSTRSGVVSYLAGDLFYGIGTVMANRIYDRFGNDTVRILDNDMNRLREVDGMTEKKFDSIKKGWSINKNERDTIIFLQSLGITPAFAKKIRDKYKDNTVSDIRKNPYALIKDIDGISFVKADQIAARLGVSKENTFRIQSAVLFVLEEMSQRGHVYLYRQQLLDECSKLLSVGTDKIMPVIKRMDKEKAIRTVPFDNSTSGIIYLPSLYDAEVTVACRLKEILGTTPHELEFYSRFTTIDGVRADENQQDAVDMAMHSKVMVLTGGPGTGKTTTLKFILKTFADAHAVILLASPTGKAAKRMTEAAGNDIGVEAQTIHRLLGIDSDTGGFRHNENDQLKGDLLVVDEASMLDIQLMEALLKAVPDKMRVIFVGDADQLPSVGPGTVLHDIIDSGTVPVKKLTKIYRQGETSDIITNAHLINNGYLPKKNNSRSSSFFFIREDDNDAINGEVVDLVSRRLPDFYGIKAENIQVLSPMKKTSNGVDALNKALQERLNPTGRGMKCGDRMFREGDKVMQIKNNYTKKVFNGDTGFVKNLNVAEKTVEVDFGGDVVSYKSDELEELVLSYAMTIHKSQGSEYPVVVIPFTTQFSIMLQRNLLYTAITRARQAVVIIGQWKAVAMAVKNNKVSARNSLLRDRLRGKF